MVNRNSSLVRAYAKALLSIGSKVNFNQEYLLWLDFLNKLMQIHKISTIVKNYLLSYNDKANLLIDLIKDSMKSNQPLDLKESKYFEYLSKFYNFVKLLSKKNHLLLLPRIYSVYEELYLSSQEILKVNVTTAIALDLNQQLFMKEKLSKYFKKKLILSYNVDQSIIAGLIIKYKDQVVDSSFRETLLQLKQTLKKC